MIFGSFDRKKTESHSFLFVFFVHSSAGSAGAEDEGATWFSGWFSWCPTSERLLEIAESQILESKFECF